MNRRTYQGAQPGLTRGDERPAPLCTPDLVDAVWDGYAPANAARPKLIPLCKRCDLRAECWSDPVWRDALGVGGGEKPKPQPEPRERPSVTVSNQERAKRAHADRLHDLEAMIAADTPLPSILKALGISRDGLYEWCRRWDHGDLWRVVSRRAA